jgi:hypothetical protein
VFAACTLTSADVLTQEPSEKSPHRRLPWRRFLPRAIGGGKPSWLAGAFGNHAISQLGNNASSPSNNAVAKFASLIGWLGAQRVNQATGLSISFSRTARHSATVPLNPLRHVSRRRKAQEGWALQTKSPGSITETKLRRTTPTM